jgi:YihY family inner membrane protein
MGRSGAAFASVMFDRLWGTVLAPKADRLGTYAAGLAYCLVLSLIPFLFVTFTLGQELTRYVPKLDLVEAYSELLADILPADVAAGSATHGQPGESSPTTNTEAQPGETTSGLPTKASVEAQHGRTADLSSRILRTLQRSHGSTNFFVGFGFAVYTSFNLMTQIVRTLLFIFDDHRRPLIWTWQIGVKTVALFGIWMFVLLFMAVCSIVTPVFDSILRQLHLDPAAWTTPLTAARNLIGLVALYFAFFLTYLLVPSKRYRIRQVRNGSFVATLGWVLCSIVFSYVLPALWQTNTVYEALGSVVIILLWAQACAWSIILGACWVVRFPARKK